MTDTTTCPVCNAAPKPAHWPCEACDGTGRVGSVWLEKSEEGEFLHVSKDVEPGPDWAPETVWARHGGKWRRWSWS